MSENLKDGTDSGNVTHKVKLQVFVSGLGICAEPNCDERLMQDRTNLGDCAHIIPRVVGSHPREDYTTPLEDRRKEPNLLYLCLKHHKHVDNEEHAKTYTTDLLRKWKEIHEEWAAGQTKNSPYLPQAYKDLLVDSRKIAEQAKVSEVIISQFLDTCQGLLDRQLINEARIFLSQIDILLLGASASPLTAKADLLNVKLLIRTEQIPEAKRRLLGIIQANPHQIEALLEYVELCDSAPEPSDEAKRLEKLARALDSDHPRWELIDLARKYKNRELVEIPDISRNWASDRNLNIRFFRQYALFCDLIQKTSQRDELINRWETELPSSPRPHLFKVLFRVSDLLRSPISSPREKARSVQEVILFSQEEREKANAKDPLILRDQISWLLQEMKLEFVYTDFSGSGKDGSELRNNLVSLIEKCYFDNFVGEILLEFLRIVQIEPNQWRMITLKIQESNVVPCRKNN